MSYKFDRRHFLIATGAMAGLATVTPGTLRAQTPRVRVVGLQVDYIDQPLGLENVRPQLSWRIESEECNIRQGAYRILVASSEGVLKSGRGDLWDSGKISSSKSLGISYQGRVLASRQCCWWCVRVWEEGTEGSFLSEVSCWEMGLLNPSDWSAQWLAVEDPVSELDRKAGLHWIWGEPTQKKTTRRFRFNFRLLTATTCGDLFAVTNDLSVLTQIARLWIDGVAAAGRGSWSDNADEVGAMESDTLRLTLKSMPAGEHLIAVEINTAALTPPMTEASLVHGLALFVRFTQENGETVRLGSGSHWKTSLVSDPDWYTSRYDDSSWEAAQSVDIHHQPWPPQPAMHLRRTFMLDQVVVQARLYATALGAYEARLNGCRVSDALLTPEISQYAKRVLYRVYDVTTMLQPGGNVLGLTVGDGWYASFDDRYAWGLPPRRVLAQLELTLADGSRQVVATGPEWRVSESPIRESQIRIGEVYDARLKQPGWDLSQFDASHWHAAQIAETPPCRLVAHTSRPIRAMQILQPRSITQPRPGVYVFEFGQNFAGWCRLHAMGASGTQVELQFAEWLTPSGEVEQSYGDSGKPKRDIFILRGNGSPETFEPSFTYRGIRYVQVSGLPAAPTVQCLEGIVAHTDLEITGHFRIGNSLIEQIWQSTVWTRRSNFVGIPTDATRREQRGYTASAALCWDDAAFNMDVCAFTSRVMDNIIDEQFADGAFPMKAPIPSNNNAADHIPGSSPGWGDAGIILPWTAWQRYGDLAIIERHWEAMHRYLQFIMDHNPEYLWKNKRSWDGGDWLACSAVGRCDSSGTPATPKELIATAYWAHSADLLGQMARATGRTSEEARLRTTYDQVRRAFYEAYVKPDGTVGSGSQTSYILALKFGLLPPETRPVAAKRLADDVRRRGVSLTTGILGTQFILDVLADAGFVDLAYGLLIRAEFPSWGDMIRRGATTIWEAWGGEVEGQVHTGEIKKVKLEQNHSDLATMSGFFFRRIAGIDAATPGFETIIVRPLVDARVKHGGADYDSVMGRISTNWTQVSDVRFTLDVTIPANTTAHICLPARRTSRLMEGGRRLADRHDMRLVTWLNHEAVIATGSGTYRFVVTD